MPPPPPPSPKKSNYSQHLFLSVKITFLLADRLYGISSGWPFRWLALYPLPKSKLTALKRNEFILRGGEGAPDNVKGKADQKELVVLDTWAVLSAALGDVLSHPLSTRKAQKDSVNLLLNRECVMGDRSVNLWAGN